MKSGYAGYGIETMTLTLLTLMRLARTEVDTTTTQGGKFSIIKI